MIKKHLVIFVLFFLFSISILIRYNQLSPIVKSHEQTYILTLQTSEIWRDVGIFNCHLTPMWTYNNLGDKYIAYYKRLEDKNGNNYYVSFPPLSFIVAHLVLYPFNIDYGKLVLQIFNLILHFISAFIIYLIICLLLNENYKKLYFPAFIAFVVYTFMPVMLYFHTDIFFPEMLGQVLWIVSIYIVLLYKKRALSKPTFTLFLILVVFFYSEWIAVFFAVTILIYYLFSKEKKTYKNLLIITSLAMLTAGVLMFIQYSSIAGIAEMFHSMGIRFLERSGFFGQEYSSLGIHIFSLHSLKLFAFNLNKALSVFGYLIIISFLFLYSKNRTFITSDFKLLIALSVIPVLIHWLVFFNANAIHLLLMARVAVLLSILAGIASYTFKNKYENIISFKILSFFLIIAFMLHSAYLYQRKFTFSEQYPSFSKIAETIKNNAKPNQSAFITCYNNFSEPEKYLTFMSKRNIVRITGVDGAIEYMNKVEKKAEVIIFNIKADGAISEIVRCDLPRN